MQEPVNVWTLSHRLLVCLQGNEGHCDVFIQTCPSVFFFFLPHHSTLHPPNREPSCAFIWYILPFPHSSAPLFRLLSPFSYSPFHFYIIQVCRHAYIHAYNSNSANKTKHVIFVLFYSGLFHLTQVSLGPSILHRGSANNPCSGCISTISYVALRIKKFSRTWVILGNRDKSL